MGARCAAVFRAALAVVGCVGLRLAVFGCVLWAVPGLGGAGLCGAVIFSGSPGSVSPASACLGLPACFGLLRSFAACPMSRRAIPPSHHPTIPLTPPNPKRQQGKTDRRILKSIIPSLRVWRAPPPPPGGPREETPGAPDPQEPSQPRAARSSQTKKGLHEKGVGKWFKKVVPGKRFAEAASFTDGAEGLITF